MRMPKANAIEVNPAFSELLRPQMKKQPVVLAADEINRRLPLDGHLLDWPVLDTIRRRLKQVINRDSQAAEPAQMSNDDAEDWEDDEPNPLLEDPANDGPTVSDWLSRKLQREMEDHIKEVAEQHDLPPSVVADLALAAALRLTAQERIRDRTGQQD